ncbi:hypothetical protein FRC07_004226 [Ceratobasidium sp. 392]|nr:hypothetical protein FRC07_004226 [Ceratobasidium sp. 392]
MPGNSSGLSNTETRAGPARNGNVPQIEVIAPEFTRRLPAPQRLPSSFKSYGLVPYPENCPVWATTFELAAEIGWAAAWELSLSQGKDAVHALSHPKEPNGSRVPVKRPTSQPGSALQRTTSKLVRQLSGALSPNHLVPSLAKSKRRTRLSELLSSNNSTPESIEKVALSSSPISEQPTRQHQSLELQSSPDAHHLKTASQKGTNRSQQNVARIREVLLPESSPSHHRALREARAAKSRHRREQDRIRREALELAKSKVTDGYCDPEDLMDRAAEAWKYAESMTNSPERNLSELAEEEWLEATRRSGTIIPPIMGEDQKQQAMHAWKDTFQRTWKEAWLDSWQAAWKSTWEYGWKEAVAKGIESGVDDALKNTTAEENKSLFDLDSYQRVKSVMHAETTYLGSLSRMHAMCKELEQLHTTLQHSIPISHEHIMEIRVNQSKKQWTKLIENLTEGGDQPTPGPRIVSHFEFQEIIEQQSRHRFQRDLPHTAFIQGMAEADTSSLFSTAPSTPDPLRWDPLHSSSTQPLTTPSIATRRYTLLFPGVDTQGHVSNFNAIEQLLDLTFPSISSTNSAPDAYSYIQIRGSVPLFWTEINTLRYRPDLQIMDVGATPHALHSHLADLKSNYGDVVLVDLANQGRAAEVEGVGYEHFDLYREYKRMRWDRTPLLTQRDVVQTNCVDCLDRVNVVQSTLVKRVLEQQLRIAGVLAEGESVDSTGLLPIFRNAWADHANCVSEACSGSGALKAGFTRTGVRRRGGVMRDGTDSATRYLKNNYFDGP